MVDGRLACKRLVFMPDDRKGRDVRVFQGFQSKPKKVSYSRDSVVEFLFTLPRIGGGGGAGSGAGGGAGTGSRVVHVTRSSIYYSLNARPA